MRNILIVGSGRSGTSMVAGTLAKSGYYMGDNYIKPRDSNPKGFYEDKEVNDINESILELITPKRLQTPALNFKYFNIPRINILFYDRPIYRERWLARIPVDREIKSNKYIQKRIKKIVNTSNHPYCFKDPRFSYTLPVWRPFLNITSYICVFRDPSFTAVSICKECKFAPYLNNRINGIRISFNQAIKIWTLMYQHILEKHRKQGDWLFIHYDQLLTNDGLNILEKFTDAYVDRSFPDVNIRKTFSSCSVPDSAIKIYKQLCILADYYDG